MKKPLLDQLRQYTASDAYPFHMPGHKRQVDFPNPFSVDITEIEGFDNLHHPDGILKESMDWAADIYGADRSFYLVNGSSSGILSAVCATTKPGGTILISRNCHKAVYHGVFLNELNVVYSYPQILDEYGVLGGLLPAQIEELLITHREVQAVLIVSPTYDGVVSDVARIAEIVHQHHLPLIVDEAHGAHFPFGEGPQSALDLGADIVIQSVHKTLPSLTQTAIMHVRRGRVDERKLERYLQIYQSSSPSYVFMSSIESAVAFMNEQGKERLSWLVSRIGQMQEELKQLKVLRLLGPDLKGRAGVYDFDCTKLLVFVPASIRYLPDGTTQQMNGGVLSGILSKEFQLEMELSAINYTVAIASCMDTPEGLARFSEALRVIDSQLKLPAMSAVECLESGSGIVPKVAMTIARAWNGGHEAVPWRDCRNRISAEFIYVYPPGIPLVAPGEVMTAEMIKKITEYRSAGLTVHGGEVYLDCVTEESERE